MYQKVSTDMDFVSREKKVAEFWKREDVIRKSFAINKGNERFTFFDGPPTANGRPHIGHIETRAFKDLIPRFHAMKGQDVLRKAGWDTHGLPVELEVEKLLKLDGKDEIERYGIEPFIKKCKESVWKYQKEWEDISDRVAFWADMDDPYVTYHNEYIESIWWSLKTIWEKDLLYKGFKVVPLLPALRHRAVQPRGGPGLPGGDRRFGHRPLPHQGAGQCLYSGMDEPRPGTLPSNVALCVNAKENYVELTLHGETVILAQALIESVFGEHAKEAQIISIMKGKELEGVEYEPLYRFAEIEYPREKGWYVVFGRLCNADRRHRHCAYRPRLRRGRRASWPQLQSAVRTAGGFAGQVCQGYALGWRAGEGS